MAQFKRKDYVYDKMAFIKPDKTIDREKLLKEARRVAKATNQRLRRLEQANLTNSPAYQGAVKAVSGYYDKTGSAVFGALSKDGKPRYKERVQNLTNDELLQLLYAAGKTQTAKTSTPAAVKALYAQGLENLKGMLDQDIASNLELNDLLSIFKDEAITGYSKLFGYRATIQIVNDLKARGIDEDIDTLKNQISEAATALGKNLNVSKLRKKLGISKRKHDPNKWIKAT